MILTREEISFTPCSFGACQIRLIFVCSVMTILSREQEGNTPLGNERRSYGPSSQGGGRGRGGHQAVEGGAGQWSNSKSRRGMNPLEALGRAM